MVQWEFVVAWIIIYSAIAFLVSKKLDIKDNVNISGPILSVRSQIGVDLVRKIASRGKRAWNAWGILGVVLAVVTGIGGFILTIISAYGIFNSPDEVTIDGPTDMIVIPGVNRFLPLSATPEIVLGLLIAMVVHEGGHAIYCRLGDINIESTGIILGALLPLGAFVEPDEEEQFEADTLDQLKMYSAGIMNNYGIFVICVIIMFAFIPMLISPVVGISVGSVLDGSPADESELEAGDVIVQANGVTVEDSQDLFNVSSDQNGIDSVKTSGGETIDMPDGVYIPRSPRVSGLDAGSTVTEYNGDNVTDARNFIEKIEQDDRQISEVTIKTENGTETSELKVGAHVTSQNSTGLAKALNLSVGNTTIVHSVNDRTVHNNNELSDLLSQNVGDEVNITYWSGDDTVTTEYTVSEDGVESLLVSSNPSGISASNLGVDNYPSETYYDVFSVGDSIQETLQNVFTTLLLPIGSLTPGVTFNFAGFTPFIQNFYTVTVGGEIVSSIVFFLLSVVFWCSWINLNLAIFNCLPTFALDGGFVLKACVERIPYELSVKTEKWVIIGIKTVVLSPLIVMLVGPLVL